jgi:hypothetical protein
MLTLDVDDLLFEIKDGAIKNAGASNKSATVKLYDVTGVDVREFGNDRVKLGFEDDEGNEIEVALFEEEAREVARGLELVEEGAED